MSHYPDIEEPAIWYHGSPLRLTELAVGSTITRDRDLARIFSHKPSLVSIDDSGAMSHNGRLPGFFYRVAEPVHDDDIVPVPGSTMPGKEWLNKRSLRITLIEETIPLPDESLTSDEENELRLLSAHMHDGNDL